MTHALVCVVVPHRPCALIGALPRVSLYSHRIADTVVQRAIAGKHFGIVIVPEGLVRAPAACVCVPEAVRCGRRRAWAVTRAWLPLCRQIMHITELVSLVDDMNKLLAGGVAPEVRPSPRDHDSLAVACGVVKRGVMLLSAGS